MSFGRSVRLGPFEIISAIDLYRVTRPSAKDPKHTTAAARHLRVPELCSD